MENKNEDTYNALMSVVNNCLFMCPFLYDEDEFGKPVSDSVIHFNADTKNSVESVIDSSSFNNVINNEKIGDNFSFNPTIITTDGRKLHINNAENYTFSNEASSQTMHYLTAANNGKQFIPLFTDIAILKNIYYTRQGFVLSILQLHWKRQKRKLLTITAIKQILMQ